MIDNRNERERVRVLRQAWREGVESDDAGPLDFAALRAEARRTLRSAVTSSREPISEDE